MQYKQFEIYKMYLSFEKDVEKIKCEIEKIPNQTFDGNSSVGYMSEELRNLKKDLLSVVNNYKTLIKIRKEEL